MLAKTKKTVLAAAALGAAVIMLAGCAAAEEPTHQDGAPVQNTEPAEAVLSAKENQKVIATGIGENIATIDFAVLDEALGDRTPADFETDATIAIHGIDVPFEGGCAYEESLAAAQNVFEEMTDPTHADGKYGPTWLLVNHKEAPEWVDEAGVYHGDLAKPGINPSYARALVQQGWARYTDFRGTEAYGIFLEEQQDAQEQGLGAWGICGDSWR